MKRQDVEELWVHLHWLIVLAEQGSYTSAAERLGVSKAAMSQRIADLERAAGVALVRRTTRSVHLTEAGMHLVDATKGSFDTIAGSFLSVRELAESPQGLLRITAPVALSRQQLVHRLPEFLRRYPGIRIELEMSDVIRSLSKDGFDLALRHTSNPPETHVAVNLCATATVLAASPDYIKSKGLPASPEELVHHSCLFYPRATGSEAWTLEKQSKASARRAQPYQVSVKVAGQFAANNSEALRDAAIAGLGIALLPDFSAQSALRSGQLAEVLSPWKSIGTYGQHLYAVRPYAAHVPRAAGVFIDFLRSEFAQGFSP